MGMMQDLRFAARMPIRKPALTLVVVLTLAVGIGASSSMFSIIRALLLRPLDLPDLDRMAIVQASRGGQEYDAEMSPGSVVDLRADVSSFENFAAIQYWETPLTGSGDPEQILAAQVGEGFFDMMGVKPLLGRWFAADEVDGKSENVAILSHELWDRRYARDPAIVGKPITIAGGSYTVVGVMTARVPFPQRRRAVGADHAHTRAAARSPLDLLEQRRQAAAGHHARTRRRRGAAARRALRHDLSRAVDDAPAGGLSRPWIE